MKNESTVTKHKVSQIIIITTAVRTNETYIICFFGLLLSHKKINMSQIISSMIVMKEKCTPGIIKIFNKIIE